MDVPQRLIADPTDELARDERPDLRCPLCDYNLRGLRGVSESRCPECGHAFDWQELIDWQDRQHPFLFEHHPRRSITSFLRTLGTSVLPRRFWRSVDPINTPVPRRLLLYWILAILVAMPLSVTAIFAPAAWERVSCALCARVEIARINQSPSQRAQAIKLSGSVERYVNTWLCNPLPLASQLQRAISDRYWHRRALFPLVAALLLWPWLTAMTLLIFRTSLCHARIRRGHVLRCVVYSADLPLPLLGPILIMAAMVLGALPYTYASWSAWVFEYGLDEQAAIALILALVLLTYRLGCAYRLYLRFRHAFLTVIASQIMVGLVLLKLMYVWWHGAWG